MLGFIPLVLAGSLTSWILVFYFSGYVALASIAAAVVIPPLTIVHGLVQGTGINWPVVFFGLFASIMAIWRHRSNIKRLRAGKEDRFDRKKRGVNKGQTKTEP
jgi:glycerol-3-phosphate acyltransferase PlsY